MEIGGDVGSLLHYLITSDDETFPGADLSDVQPKDPSFADAP